MKKLWEKPKLVILVRSEPEERVLTTCKTGKSSAQPGDVYQGCDHTLDGAAMAICSDCSTWGAS
jgi:hypothetical protein